MSHVGARAQKLFEELKALHMLMEERKTELENEQADYEQAMEDWDKENEDIEPYLVENDQDISLLREQLLDLDTIIAGMEEIAGALND